MEQGASGGSGGAGVEPGWYPDPHRQAKLRWWDGTAWTEHVDGATGPAGSPAAQAPQAPQSPRTPQAAQTPQAAAGTKTSGWAIASLVLGILGGSLLAIVFGFVGRSQIARSGGAVRGRGLATAGIVLGFLWLLAIIAGVTLAVTGAFEDEPSTTATPSGDRQEVVALIERFEDASQGDRFGEICRELFTPAWTRQIEAGADQSCEAEFRENDEGDQKPIKVEKVNVTGTTASAEIIEGTDPFDISLVNEGGRWRITSIEARTGG